MLNHFSHVWLSVTLWTVACQGPLPRGFSRQEYWSGLPRPPPGDLPDPGIKSTSLMSPALAGRFLYNELRYFLLRESVQFSRSVVSDSATPWITAPHHQLPEFTQTHVHRVGDAIQPSHPNSLNTESQILLIQNLKQRPTKNLETLHPQNTTPHQSHTLKFYFLIFFHLFLLVGS